MSINEVRYLTECGSTNAYVKEHFEEFGPVGAVYTTNQTAGRGRLGRTWVNAEGRALYYTVAIREPPHPRPCGQAARIGVPVQPRLLRPVLHRAQHLRHPDTGQGQDRPP